VAPAGSALDPELRETAPGLLAERAYGAIRDRIVSLELGPGAVIDERALIAALGIGRTPIREALRRLAQERLVEVYPRRGMFVTGVDVRDLARLSEVRAVLEPEAARLAALRATPREREELGALVAELGEQGGLGGRELIVVDERIHRSVYRLTHNQFLASTLEQYFVLALRIWYLALDQAVDLEEAVLEHAALLEAVRDGQGERAAALMADHVENFARSMRSVLTAAAAPPARRPRQA
jgi:DNA-binding GntR family transcriptional regulator